MMSASNLPISEQREISTWWELERSFPGLASSGSSPHWVWDVGPQVASVDQGCRASSCCFVTQPDWSHWVDFWECDCRRKSFILHKMQCVFLRAKSELFLMAHFQSVCCGEKLKFLICCHQSNDLFPFNAVQAADGHPSYPEHLEIHISHSTTSCNNCATFPKEPGLFLITSPQWGPVSPVAHPWENRNKQRRVPLQHHFQGRRWKSICLISVNQPLRWAHGVHEECGPQGSKPSCYPSQFIIFSAKI